MAGLDNLDRVVDIIRKASSNAIASADLRNGKFPLLFICILLMQLILIFVVLFGPLFTHIQTSSLFLVLVNVCYFSLYLEFNV
jgi:hypothetical protein